MSEFFAYENLTWPDVAALPRSVPLVIPLGEGFQFNELACSLDNPPQIGLLPPIPFGWPDSRLPVAEPLLTALVDNLLDSLVTDGFQRAFIMAPHGLELNMRDEQRLLHVDKFRSGDDLTFHWPADADRGKVTLIPIGHTEQHGFHLPLSTDTLIIEAISQGVAAAIPEQATCLPVMPYGVSTHRSSFAGTLDAGGRAFEDFWLGVIDTLTERGVEMLYLLSGHGGNCSFLTNVVKYAGERHPYVFSATAWLYLSGPEGIEALEKLRRSSRGGMGHACELETSLMLYLKPELVHMEHLVDEMDFITTPSYFIDWVEGGSLVANPPWEDDSVTGAYGAGSLASTENGTIWFKVAVGEKSHHVGEIIEQQRRRSARRLERRSIVC
jgi:creatinine amidohydrolase